MRVFATYDRSRHVHGINSIRKCICIPCSIIIQLQPYERILTVFRSFLEQFCLPIALPVPPIALALYISFLHKKGYALSTIQSHMSVISHIHTSKCHSLPEPNISFLVQKSIQGVWNNNTSSDLRLPISSEMLQQLSQSLQLTCSSPFKRTLFRAMFLLAFYAFLRVGEMEVSHHSSHHILHLHQIQFHPHNSSMFVLFTHYKHSKGRSHTITVQNLSPHCLVDALHAYIKMRGSSPGFLFLSAGGQPIQRGEFVQQLNKCVVFLKLDPSFYMTHSFRIRAATHAARSGKSDAQIRHMGRWHSDAFLRYIRLG